MHTSIPEVHVPFINREISWLAFNARVLQEANDPTVPIMERIKFLAIFSSNLDEFFRVRVAALKRLLRADPKQRADEKNPDETLDEIQRIVTKQQFQFEEYYQRILTELRDQHIAIVTRSELTPEQETFLRAYFTEKVRPAIVPMMMSQLPKFPVLQEQAIYLAVHLQAARKRLNRTPKSEYAIVEVPTDEISRFILLPSHNGDTTVMLLEDLVSLGLPELFAISGWTVLEAFPMKVTKDAELDIEDDVTRSFVEKISKSLKMRPKGKPVRLTYDWRMSEKFLKFLAKRLNLSGHDTLLPERRHLNFKDFMKFPKLAPSAPQYPSIKPLRHKDIHERVSLFDLIRARDILLHYPYQSFDYMIDLLREAAIDPNVTTIRMTLYRVAELSKIVNALSHAVRNGKQVTVLFEFRARFDEEANIYWANQLIEEGARVLYGIPDLKVHSKLCLITRLERGKHIRYAAIGTGNFNEDTARLYCDHALLTADKRLTSEIKAIFDFLKTNYKLTTYKHLLVSPFFMRDGWYELIRYEIRQANAGKAAFIDVKLNSLSDPGMIQALYEASQAGVKIRLIVRGICSLVPGVPGVSDNIEVISIIDKFLEHSRIIIFCHGGREKYYIASADWMTRNLDTRVEVACPIYDAALQKELRAYFDLQWRDNVKARMITETLDNQYRQRFDAEPLRSQEAIYDYLRRQLPAES